MAIAITEYLTKGKTESSDSQTLIVDLPADEQIFDLMLEIRITNSTTVYNNYSILDEIDKIEIVSGNKTLFDLEPEMASYCAFVAQGGKLPDHRFFQGASAVSRLHLPIYFGRFPLDEEYLLDTKDYPNPQLRITYSMDTTYSATGTFTHTISYRRPLNKLSPKGFIRSWQVKQETTSAAAQTIRHELPRDLPWHYLAVRLDDVDQDINTVLSEVDVNLGSGRLHLLDVEADEAYYYDMRRFPRISSYVNQPVVTGQDTAVLTFGDWAHIRGATNVGTGARIIGVDNVAGEQCRITVLTDAGSQATDAIPVALDAPSSNPHSCLTLFDGRKQPFFPGDYKDAWVDYKINAYVITITTFIQEIVTGVI
jgi:hypothetical protein